MGNFSKRKNNIDMSIAKSIVIFPKDALSKGSSKTLLIWWKKVSQKNVCSVLLHLSHKTSLFTKCDVHNSTRHACREPRNLNFKVYYREIKESFVLLKSPARGNIYIHTKKKHNKSNTEHFLFQRILISNYYNLFISWKKMLFCSRRTRLSYMNSM